MALTSLNASTNALANYTSTAAAQSAGSSNMSASYNALATYTATAARESGAPSSQSTASSPAVIKSIDPDA